MKKQIIKILSILSLIASILALPFFGITILFGLSGSTSKFFILIALGYIGIIISSIISIFRYKFFWLVILSLVLMIIGLLLNNSFWEEHNNQLCEDLRSDPTCIENEFGFDCSDFQGQGGFFTGKEVCEK